MSPFIKKALKFILFLGIGIGLIYLSVKDISLKEWKKYLSDNPPNYWWLVASTCVGLLSHLIRAQRWRMLIEPVAEKPKLSNTFFSVMIGYMANYAPLPRLGEVYRCGILSRYEKAPFVSLVGTVIIERTIDLLMLVLFFFLMLFLESKKAYDMIHELDLGNKFNDWAHSHLLIMGFGAVVVAAGIVFVLRGKNKLFGVLRKYIQNFWQGMKSVAKLKNPITFWTYSIGIWVLYLVSTYLCFFCFNQTSGFSIGDGLVILIVGSVAVIVTPGGTGAYQFLISGVLAGPLYHIDTHVALTLAWIIWGSQFVLIVTLGLISLMLLPILNKNDNKTGSNTIEGTN